MSYMDEPEYMRIAFKYFPKDIIQQYNLTNKVAPDGFCLHKDKVWYV